MTHEGWKHVIEFANENESAKLVLADLLSEYDKAKQRLRDNGYGVTGTPLITMINEIIDKAKLP